ncbi:MAG: ABC transporter permease [Bacilli bacterium]|nr:ABC transporter permease [Bacilli bacterium]MDD4795016.1 ABC transporter permease [Bacilli bacterium]
MFFHIFINKLKILLKNKSMIFWTLFFPLALATFFYLAFSNIDSNEKFTEIDIAIVDNEQFQNNVDFKHLMASLSNEENIFNTDYVNIDVAKKLLEDNRIKGYILVEDEINVYIKENGISQTIIKSVIDNFYQINSAVNHIFIEKQEITNIILADLNQNYFNDISNDKISSTVTYFYTLIGMVCLYGGFFGVNALNESESNLSKRAARLNVSPIHKLKFLLISLLVAFIIQYMETLILLSYVVYILKVDFGNQILPIIILTANGTIAGISFGAIVGLSNKGSENTKTGILVSVTMLLSFLAGMMIGDIKYLIEKNIPLLAKINPVNMITDALYSLYYYNNLDKYFSNLFSLIIFSFIMITVSYIILRRKKYDSI